MNKLCILLLTLACSSPVEASNRVFKEFRFNGKSINYAIQLPNDFNPSKTYPVLIGPSEVQNEDDQSFYWRGVKDTQGWILIDYPIYEYGRRKKEVQAFLDHLISKYNVEGDKFHTVCFSANSARIFDMVMDIPQNFHSITGMAGNPGTRDKEKLSALKNIKVQFIVGDRDSYWMKAAKDRHQLLLEAGAESSIEIIKNGQHVMKNLIGKGFLARAEKMR